MLTLCAIGSTGVGKSSFCNLLSGEPKAFHAHDGINACTEKTTSSTHRWMGTGGSFVLIDTPGLGDPGGKDSQNIAEMVKVLKSKSHVNAFLLTVNSQVPRLDEYMRANLQIFRDVFGAEFFKHVILVFTRWGHDSRAMRDRQRTGITKEKKQQELDIFIKQKYHLEQDLSAIFLDNFPDFTNSAEKIETLREIESLKSLASAMPNFMCLDAQARKGYLDQLKAKEAAERVRKMKAQAEAKEKAAQAELEKRNRQEEARKLEEKIEQDRKKQKREQAQKELDKFNISKQILEEKIRIAVPAGPGREVLLCQLRACKAAIVD